MAAGDVVAADVVAGNMLASDVLASDGAAGSEAVAGWARRLTQVPSPANRRIGSRTKEKPFEPSLVRW